MCPYSPSAPGPEPVGAVLAGLYDDEALPGEAELVRLAAAPADQGRRLEAALALHLETAGPGDERVRVHIGLVLAAAAAHDDRGAAGGQRDPSGAGDAHVEQALPGELGDALDPFDTPLEVGVEGGPIGAADA